jgi:hypothetical protein
VIFTHKKRITERNSHLAGEASGSSISNGCQAKTERRRQLTRVRTGRKGNKVHASVAGSRVTAFLATSAPWEPYFTVNPRVCVCVCVCVCIYIYIYIYIYTVFGSVPLRLRTILNAYRNEAALIKSGFHFNNN